MSKVKCYPEVKYVKKWSVKSGTLTLPGRDGDAAFFQQRNAGDRTLACLFQPSPRNLRSVWVSKVEYRRSDPSCLTALSTVAPFRTFFYGDGQAGPRKPCGHPIVPKLHNAFQNRCYDITAGYQFLWRTSGKFRKADKQDQDQWNSGVYANSASVS